MYGSSLVGLVASVIVERPTCLVCLTHKVGASQLEIVRAIERMAKTVRIRVHPPGERCRACGITLGPIYSVSASETSQG